MACFWASVRMSGPIRSLEYSWNASRPGSVILSARTEKHLRKARHSAEFLFDLTVSLSGDSPRTPLDGQQGSVGSGSLGTGLENIAKLGLKWRILPRRGGGGGGRAIGKAHIAARPHCCSAHVQKGKDGDGAHGAVSWRSERRREKDARGKLSRVSREASRLRQILHQWSSQCRGIWPIFAGLFPLSQFPLCQLLTSSILTLSVPTLSTLTKLELTKWELTKWEDLPFYILLTTVIDQWIF